MMSGIHGRIVSGTGRGSKFIAMAIYSSIFQQILRSKPYLGTLNIKLSPEYVNLVNEYFLYGTVHEDLLHEGQPTGGLIVNKFVITKDDQNITCVGVRPNLTSHTSDILELVSQYYLRDKLGIETGSIVELSINEFDT